MVVAEGSVSESKVAGLTTDTEYDSLNLEQKTKLRSLNLERQKSCGVSKAILNGVEHDGCQPCHQPPTLEYIECGDTPKGPCVTWAEPTSETSALHMHTMAAAWEALKHWIVYFRGEPIGTVAAIDKSQAELNYDQVFMRDFVPSALAFLVKGEPLIVKNFVLETARLQSREKMVDLFKLGQGVMPASFKVHHCHLTRKTETLLADFGDIAIGLVAPVDSGLWWILLLRAYTLYTFDNSLAQSPHCQRAMHLILKLWLSEGFDTSPTLLCADGCSMIDRRIVSQSCVTWAEPTSETSALHRHTMAAAWEAIKQSIVYFRGQPIGTVAAVDKSQAELNYNQVSMRHFVPSALAFLMKGEPLIVKNFLLETARLQSREKMVDLFKLGLGVMPASFKVHHCHLTQKTETLLADFGEIAPVDSGLWWIFLLRAYKIYTFDNSLAENPHCQRAMHLILKLWLSEGFDTSPSLLCADGCSMIDRRMSCRSAPGLSVAHIITVLLLMLSISGLGSASSTHSCEVASLATNIRLFCGESHPSSLCCESINAAASSQDGIKCLCLVGNSPDIMTLGFSAQNLISLNNLCSHHEDEYDCDDESDKPDFKSDKTGIQKSGAEAGDDEQRPRQRDQGQKTRKPDPKDGDFETKEASTEVEHEEGVHPRSKHTKHERQRPRRRDHYQNTHKSDPETKEGSTEDEQEMGVHPISEDNGDLQPQQHGRLEYHSSSSSNSNIIGLMAAFLVLVLVAAVVVPVVLKYKQQRTDLRQLLRIALASALPPPVPTQVAARGVFRIRGFSRVRIVGCFSFLSVWSRGGESRWF